MSNIVIAGDTSGSVTLQAPAVAGGTVVTLPATTGTAALTSDLLGVGQTWQDVKASRVSGTTYTNSTGKPIMVMVGAIRANSGYSMTVVVNGVTIVTADNSGVFYGSYDLSFIVPSGNTYVVTGSIRCWAELR